MRVHEKKKNRRAHIRAQTLAGMAYNASGAWFKPGGGNSSESTDSPIIKNAYYGTCGKKGPR